MYIEIHGLKLTLTFLQMISFPVLGGIGVFSGIVNLIIKSVKFLFRLSIDKPTAHTCNV